MTQAQLFLPALTFCSLSVAIDEELTRLVDDPRCFAPRPPGRFCGSLSLAIWKRPLAAGGCPMTATTQRGGSSTTMVTDQAAEGTCVDLGVVRGCQAHLPRGSRPSSRDSTGLVTQSDRP